MRETSPRSFDAADRMLVQNAAEYIRSGAVPSSVAINVVVVSTDGQLLCAKRSAAVDNGVGLWCLGIFETMKRNDPNRPGQPEDFYALAERALAEELGLNRHHYGNVHITWVGIYQPLLRGHVVGIVRLKVSKAVALERARESDSSYEHAGFDWLPLNRKTVRSFEAAGELDGTSTARRRRPARV